MLQRVEVVPSDLTGIVKSSDNILHHYTPALMAARDLHVARHGSQFFQSRRSFKNCRWQGREIVPTEVPEQGQVR